ncbi:MAG: TlpA family protein disulfide reductase [Burkholderiales bacterium]|nr:TlpA family protein disulfide reductase [Burkholderiales bacterium]
MRKLLPFALLVFFIEPAVAQQFSLTDASGKIHRLSDHRGKWVLVNFWATWCPPCLEEMPDLGALYDARRGKDLLVIGVAVEFQNPREVIEFADNMLVSYPVVLGDKKVTDQFARIRGLPTTLIYDPKGELVKSHLGAITRKQVEAIIGPAR